MSTPQARAEAPSRHLWIVAGLALFIGAMAGGYALALHEIIIGVPAI